MLLILTDKEINSGETGGGGRENQRGGGSEKEGLDQETCGEEK